MGNEKKVFKLMDGYVLIFSKGKEKISSIINPNTGSYEQRKQWISAINDIYDIADNVKSVKIGDKVLLEPIRAKMRGEKQLTKIMGEKLNKEMTIVTAGIEEELEKYFIVKEDEIMCIVN